MNCCRPALATVAAVLTLALPLVPTRAAPSPAPAVHGDGFLIAPKPKPAAPKSPTVERPAVTEKAAPAHSLVALYQALDGLEAHRRGQPVTILQIGDSHTANDAFSGRMRELFQQRFGDGGRGLLPAGIAFKTYNPSEVQVTASAGWTLVNSFDPGTAGPFGISGLRQHSDAKGETMTLAVATPASPTAGAPSLQAAAQLLGLPGTKPANTPTAGVQEAGADHATIEVMNQPGGGRIEFAVDGKPRYAWRTEGPPSVNWITVALPRGSRSVTLKTVDAKPVDILSWSVGRRGGGGVQWANHGTIGATIDLISRWDPSVVSLEMKQLQPALIVVAFGTNEGFQDATNLDTYASRYATALNVLRAGAAGASVAIMGPPDGNRAINTAAGPATSCSPRADLASTAPQYVVPAKLPQVRTLQAQLATRNDAYFFDWSAAMGGACSMHRWTELTPPLGQPDHVHLRAAGYRQTADVMFTQLMEGYEGWKAGRRRR